MTEPRFPRFHAAPKQVQMPLCRPPSPPTARPMSAGCLAVVIAGLALVMVLVVEAFAQEQTVPKVTLPMPAPAPYEDCVAQNADAPDLLAGCEALMDI